MQITAITPEQKARFAEWREKWIKIGLSTEPADFEKAEKAALKAYALCNLERPKIILRMGSPCGATVGSVMVWLMLRGMLSYADLLIKHQIDQEVWQQIDQMVWQQIKRQIGLYGERQVCQQAWRYVWHQIKRQFEYQVGQRVAQKVRRQVRKKVDLQIRRQVEQQVGQRLGQHVDQQVWRQVSMQVDPQLRQRIWQHDVFVVASEGFYNNYGGSFHVDWCAYVTFMRDVLGWEDPMLVRFTIDEDLATSCGWVWWGEEVLAISDRPSEIHLDAEGRLHNESGPSIVYRDGWKLYHVHGTDVPDFVVEHPETITIEHIEREMNAEVRRVMVSRMGLERFVRESGLQPVHSDDFGTLYRKEMPGDEPLVVVKVVNSTPEPSGSRKEYFLRVPPNITRAREAVAWTFGMEEKEYRPATET